MRRIALFLAAAVAVVTLSACVSSQPPAAPPGDVGPSQDAVDNRALESRGG
jgi:hypothetical protein